MSVRPVLGGRGLAHCNVNTGPATLRVVPVPFRSHNIWWTLGESPLCGLLARPIRAALSGIDVGRLDHGDCLVTRKVREGLAPNPFDEPLKLRQSRTMPAGRPSTYEERFGPEVEEMLARGHSLTACAGHIGVSRQTIYEWKEVHPEFADTVKRGQAKSALAWENKLMSGEGNATLLIFGLKNRAKDEWSDMTRSEITGKDGEALIPTMTDLERAKAVAALVAGVKQGKSE